MGDNENESTEGQSLEYVRGLLARERESWAQERQQYQQRITELLAALVGLGAPSQVASEQKREIRERVLDLREALEHPGLAQAERNALGIELARLEPLAL